VYVCKYTGKPGVDEVLQGGGNPIEVSINALEGKGFDGTFPFEFSDAQGRSVAIGYVGYGNPVKTIEDCPKPEGPPAKPPEPPVQPPVQPQQPPAQPVQPPVAPQQPAPPSKYAPAASISEVCGDPRIRIVLDNTASTVSATFKILFRHPQIKGKRVVKYKTLPAGASKATEWTWVRGGNWVRVRDIRQTLLAKKRIVDPTPWGKGSCPQSRHG
jgi:hypothetical protein